MIQIFSVLMFRLQYKKYYMIHLLKVFITRCIIRLLVVNVDD
jgi:hypothetical protein